MSTLPVFYRANECIALTFEELTRWFKRSFIPQVRLFLQSRKLPFKILLVVDSVPIHSILYYLVTKAIKVVYIPPILATQIAPMAQSYIAPSIQGFYVQRLMNVIKQYRETQQQLIDKSIDEEKKIIASEIIEEKTRSQQKLQSLQSFWNKFDIKQSIHILDKVWNEDISRGMLIDAWRWLYPCYRTFDDCRRCNVLLTNDDPLSSLLTLMNPIVEDLVEYRELMVKQFKVNYCPDRLEDCPYKFGTSNFSYGYSQGNVDYLDGLIDPAAQNHLSSHSFLCSSSNDDDGDEDDEPSSPLSSLSASSSSAYGSSKSPADLTSVNTTAAFSTTAINGRIDNSLNSTSVVFPSCPSALVNNNNNNGNNESENCAATLPNGHSQHNHNNNNSQDQFLTIETKLNTKLRPLIGRKRTQVLAQVLELPDDRVDLAQQLLSFLASPSSSTSTSSQETTFTINASDKTWELISVLKNEYKKQFVNMLNENNTTTDATNTTISRSITTNNTITATNNNNSIIINNNNIKQKNEY